MRLSKKQMDIVNELSNQGFIWFAGTNAYLAQTDKDGRIKSKMLNMKTFNALKEGNVLEEREGKWYLA